MRRCSSPVYIFDDCEYYKYSDSLGLLVDYKSGKHTVFIDGVIKLECKNIHIYTTEYLKFEGSGLWYMWDIINERIMFKGYKVSFNNGNFYKLDKLSGQWILVDVAL